MQLQFYAGTLIAPALVAAMPWDGGLPTSLAPPEIDRWSPAPTGGPRLLGPLIELFRKRDEGDNTCGFVSGAYSRPVTCNNKSYVCATNTYNGVHGCCNPSSIESCVIPTACVPSASIGGCLGTCLENFYVLKCTNSASPYCYNWVYSFNTPSPTMMTEYGCHASALTLTVLPTATNTGGSSSNLTPTSSPQETTSFSSSSSRSVTTSTSSTTSSQTQSPTNTSSPSLNAGAIAGGVVGGLAVLGATVTGVIFLILRARNKKTTSSSTGPQVQLDYKPVAPGHPGPINPNYAPYGQQYGQPMYMQPGPYSDMTHQPGNTISFCQPPSQDGKHNYALQKPAEAMSQPIQQFSPAHSPTPEYAQPQPIAGAVVVPPPHDGAVQLDSTPIQGQPIRQDTQIHEAPTGRE